MEVGSFLKHKTGLRKQESGNTKPVAECRSVGIETSISEDGSLKSPACRQAGKSGADRKLAMYNM